MTLSDPVRLLLEESGADISFWATASYHLLLAGAASHLCALRRRSACCGRKYIRCIAVFLGPRNIVQLLSCKTEV